MADATDVKMFTSWKLDWIDALMIGVNAREFHIAVSLLQHANSKTKLIRPSQARIALLLNCSISSVERAIGRLVKDGWLARSRDNRQQSNSYQFVEARRHEMFELRDERETVWKAIRRARGEQSDPAVVTAQECGDPAEVTGRDTADVMAPDPAEVTGKHLNGTPEGEHLLEVGIDEEGYRADGFNTEPREEVDGEARPQGGLADGDFRALRTVTSALENSDIIKGLQSPRVSAKASLDAQFGNDDWPPRHGKGAA